MTTASGASDGRSGPPQAATALPDLRQAIAPEISSLLLQPLRADRSEPLARRHYAIPATEQDQEEPPPASMIKTIEMPSGIPNSSAGLVFVAGGGSIPYTAPVPACAQVAQLVEQRTENPRVGGSIPPLGTIISLVKSDSYDELASPYASPSLSLPRRQARRWWSAISNRRSATSPLTTSICGAMRASPISPQPTPISGRTKPSCCNDRGSDATARRSCIKSIVRCSLRSPR